jgi:hypothetical protein
MILKKPLFNSNYDKIQQLLAICELLGKPDFSIYKNVSDEIKKKLLVIPNKNNINIE